VLLAAEILQAEDLVLPCIVAASAHMRQPSDI
jgi:hypothetical protein